MKKTLLTVAVLTTLAATSTAAFAQSVARIYVKPGHVSLRPGTVQKFIAYATDAFDSDVPINDPLTWSTTAGTITPDGVFTAGKTTGKFVQGVTATTQAGIKGTAMVTISAPAPSNGYVFERSWGNHIPAQLLCPSAIGIGPNGTILVADRGSECIQHYDSSGQHVNMIGPKMSANIRLDSVSALASFGNYIYAAESYTIYKLDTQGTVVATWGGSRGSGVGQFNSIKSMAFDRYGNLFVLDPANNRVVKLNSSGYWISSFGSPGSGDGQFSHPMSICVGPDNMIYVADSGNRRVQKFSASGQFVGKWTVYNNSYESEPYTVSSDSQGNIYVTDTYNSVLKTSSSGSSAVRIETSVPLNGTYNACVDASGNIYSATDEDRLIRLGAPGPTYMFNAYVEASRVIYTTMDDSRVSVQKFGPTGSLVAEWGKPRAGTLYRPGGVAVGPDNQVYVAETRGGKVQVFDDAGSITDSWRPALGDPSYLRFDNQGFLYVTDWMGAGKYTRTGTSIRHFDLPFPSLIPPDTHGVAVAPGGDVYISQMGQNTITRLSAEGQVVATWQSAGTGPGQFLGPTGLATDSSGNLYVADRENGRIQKLDANGQYLGQWPAGGSSSHTVGVCLGSDGSVFAVNYYPGTVVKYAADGALLGSWGSIGRESDQFFAPTDVALDKDGNFYVADQDNNRICKYAALQRSTCKAKELRDGDFAALTDQVVTAGSDELEEGELYVQSPDRSGGIRVKGISAGRGAKLTVIGTVTTVDGERVIEASSLTEFGSSSAAPIALTNKSLGGAELGFDPATGAGQRGVEDGQGANNIGLLVTTTGKVTARGTDFFYIDDGTHARDGSIFVGVKVLSRTMNKPAEGSYVSVTGISRIYRVGDRYFRAIAPRIAPDIRVIN